MENADKVLLSIASLIVAEIIQAECGMRHRHRSITRRKVL